MKRPATQYYWGDWRRDTALQACSIGARGLWHEMNCLMHDCDPYGYLVINGKPMTDAQLASLVGVSHAQCKSLRTELLNAAIYSVDDAGRIFSRRMVRDETLRAVRAAGGQLGAEYGIQGAAAGSKGGRPTKQKGASETPLQPYLNGGEITPLRPSEKPPPASASASASASNPPAAATGPPIRETEPPPPTAAPPPLSNGNGTTERANDIAGLLRHRGAKLTASDPRVRGWASAGVTDAQLLTALDTAVDARHRKADPTPINAGFLDVILADVRSKTPTYDYEALSKL